MQLNKRIKKTVKWGTALIIMISVIGVFTVGAVEEKFNMSYIYFGDTSVYAGYVDRTQDTINEISPAFFELDSDGSLKIVMSINQSLIDEMHDKNISVVPFLTNNWDRALGKTALQKREALASQIANAVVKYNLDGINVDLENLTETERAAYTDFVRLLREKLPQGKTIAVAVAANPNGNTTGWQGSYDYTGLAKYSDYLMLMIYDEHYDGSIAGPVASASFVEKSLQYALKKVSNDKIVLGIPFYGRIWNNSSGYPQGYGISNTKAVDLISKYSGKVVFDKTSQTPFATITIKSSDTKPVVGGKALSAGTYTIWFENEQSIKYKLTMVEKYNIKGTGSWSLGQETAGTWDYYKLWLNGCYFKDVQGNWAMESILSAYKNGWIKGVTSTTFLPNAALTRAQAAAILVRVLGISVNTSQAATFEDTHNHWAQAEIEAARQAHLIDGVGDNLFAPDETITREQMAVMLSNIDHLLSGDGNEGLVFSDINPTDNSWSFESIITISKYGIITGYPDGSFRPKEDLTRAEMTVMMERLSQYLAQK